MKNFPAFGEGLTLFLLAHPDDDIFVRPLIARTARGGGAAVAYLTKEQARYRGVRRVEAEAALRPLNVMPDAVFFPGEAVGAIDGRAIESLDALYDACQDISSVLRPARLITHAYEGGHPDHDAAHLVALKLARALNIPERSYAASYYRASRAAFPPFVVQTPPREAENYIRAQITFAEAADMVAAMRRYPSQWRALLGFGPPLAARALLDRTLPLQPLSRSRAPARPTDGPLLVETQFKTPFAVIAAAATRFLDEAGQPGAAR